MERVTGFEPVTYCLGSKQNVFKLLNNFMVSQLAELINFSKPYIGNIKNGVLPPSDKFLNAFIQAIQKDEPNQLDYVSLYFQSRKAVGCSINTIEFYKYMLLPFIQKINYLNAKPSTI